MGARRFSRCFLVVCVIAPLLVAAAGLAADNISPDVIKKTLIVVTDKRTGRQEVYPWTGTEYRFELRHIAHFLSFMGRFEVRGQAIYLHEDVEKEARADPASYKAKHPSWNGQPLRAAKWVWDEKAKRFVYAGESFYSNLRTDLPDLWALADTDDTLSLKISGKPWASLVPRGVRVKAFASADLDGDKQNETVVLWADPKKEDPFGGFAGFVPKTLAVFKPTRQGFVTLATLDGIGASYIFSRMTVQDITGDRLAEVLIWGYSPGGSGGTAVLDVFAKDVGQRYVAGR